MKSSNYLPDLDAALHPLRSLVVDPIQSITTAPFRYFQQEILLDNKSRNLNAESIESTREWLAHLRNYTFDEITELHKRLANMSGIIHSDFEYTQSVRDLALSVKHSLGSALSGLAEHIKYIEILSIISLLGISIALILLFLQNSELRKQITKIKETLDEN